MIVDKACLQHYMADRVFKDLPRRTNSDKVLRDKAFSIAENPNIMDINVDLLQYFTNFLTKILRLILLKANIFSS